MNVKPSVDFSVSIKRNPKNQTYKVEMLEVKQDGAFEIQVCRNLFEVFKVVSEFQSKYMNLFDGDIEYQKVDWRDLA